MKVGIVGFRGSGKTTVFNALTGLHAEVGGYHGADVKNLGNIKVPDKRLEKIAEQVKPKKLIHAEIVFADLAATTASQGKGFSGETLAEMRQSDALVHVVRGFDNPDLSDSMNILRDIEAFESEICLADLMVVENRLQRLKKQGTKSREREYLEAIQSHLEEEKALRTLDLGEPGWSSLTGFGFLSRKHCLLLLNVPEDAATEPPADEIVSYAEEGNLRLLSISGEVEMEVNDLEADEALEYLKSVGLEEPAKGRFIREAYDMLQLISFFTFGPDEVRAWTIRKGLKAQQAAGKIHSDIERGFIRAEVMQWEDVVEHVTEGKIREANKMKLEGKEYIPKDGECIHFRFNV